MIAFRIPAKHCRSMLPVKPAFTVEQAMVSEAPCTMSALGDSVPAAPAEDPSAMFTFVVSDAAQGAPTQLLVEVSIAPLLHVHEMSPENPTSTEEHADVQVEPCACSLDGAQVG
jgi:hypothetical protein